MSIALLEQPHTEARRLVATGAPVYLTVNPVEYHGPHLSLHNDRLVAQGLCRDIHARVAGAHPDWPMLVGADLEVGVEPCPGRGTRHTRFPMTRELVLEACRALAELGARRVVLMTFHGAPLHNIALQAGVDWLRDHDVAAVAPFNLALRELLMLDDPSSFAAAVAPVADPHARAALLAGLRTDFHAGFFETSVALHYAPASVSEVHRTLAPCPPIEPVELYARAANLARSLGSDRFARELDFAAVGVGWGALRPFPGYTGQPAHASASSGAVFAGLMVDLFTDAVLGVFDRGEPPPEPIMRWVETVSLGGRIGPSSRPS